VNADPPQDQYFKGALFIHTLRSIVGDDKKWWPMLREFYQRFKYKNIMTEDVAAYFSEKTGMNLKPVFDQYLRHTSIPKLELNFSGDKGRVLYRWKTDEPNFAMPVGVGNKDKWTLIHPTNDWQTMESPIKMKDFEVATDLFYVDVTKLEFLNDPAGPRPKG